MASGDSKPLREEATPPPPSSSSFSENWKERIFIPTLLAGITGGGVGLVSKHGKVHGLANISATYATNFAIVAGCYCGAREFLRVTRKSEPDDLVNSAIAGFGSGALLGRLQGEVFFRLAESLGHQKDRCIFNFVESIIHPKTGAFSIPSVVFFAPLLKQMFLIMFVIFISSLVEPMDKAEVSSLDGRWYKYDAIGGQFGAFRYSIIFAVVGTTVDFATIRLRATLSSFKESIFRDKEKKAGWLKLPEWSPIQVLDEEALAAKEAREKQLYGQSALGKLSKEES
ncbi:unnamed protein product [Dovyalis caffra]|uniref:Mitochondrial inner membrane translocase subunit Tim17/Tim22/Tim23/peroxisomal protein PMP24 n=1 Tax=Dovyalis caffra TaxID=77055 RepID=A0AAV1SD73_9ROSI|nr:unnamed protein product [Dovyalis caffra]